ncbi:MAG TPA: acyltransferase family protein [Longimicrobium sp.]|nr:acyltransferase family protein [Longimicrobium sp.]
MTKTYRPDIDALRTIAVVPVILFHLGAGGFEGGYVGVDVFFVISGFLITGIILDAGPDFTLPQFYRMRARRILPALFVMVAAVLAAAAFIMLPADFRGLCQSAVAVATYTSNFYFWLRSGYFDAASHSRPLLHTWSLGVEEQFYILFPLLMMLLRPPRASRRTALAVLGALAALSFALSVLLPGYQRGDSFYLPHFRGWELLIGALLACAAPSAPRSETRREALAWIGVGMIAYAVLTFDRGTAFPGVNALYPCLGAALVIHARPGGRLPMGRLLHHRAVVFAGLISYSLYLWHWPVIVLYRYYHFREPDAAAGVALVAATFVLAVLSWRFVEMPVRRSSWSTRTLFTRAAAVSAGLVTVGLAGHLAGGFPQRFGQPAPQPDHRAAYNPGTCFLQKKQAAGHWRAARCTFAPPGAGTGPRVLLWGDSHAAHLTPGLLSIQAERPFVLTEAAFAGCPPLAGYGERENPRCRPFNDAVLAYVTRERPDIVLLSARWNAFRDPRVLQGHLEETIRLLQARGVRPVLIGESPSFAAPAPDIAYILQRRGRSPESFAPSGSFRVDEAMERLSRRLGVDYLSPRRRLCWETTCRLQVDGRLLYWDESHFTAFGSRYVALALSGFLGGGGCRGECPGASAGRARRSPPHSDGRSVETAAPDA